MTYLRFSSVTFNLLAIMLFLTASTDTETIIGFLILVMGNVSTTGLVVVQELRKNNS